MRHCAGIRNRTLHVAVNEKSRFRLFFSSTVHTMKQRIKQKRCRECAADDEYGGAEMDLMLELEDARIQWKNMQTVYNEVSDPALIDTVIYQVMAAEQRYEYLLRLAKQEALTCENIPVR